MGQGYDTFAMVDPSFDAVHSERIAGKYFPATEPLLPKGWRCFFFAPHWVTRKMAVSGYTSGTRIEGVRR
ncbi:MAG: hypothetical protein ACRDTG_25305 [Pseudonocardiaceae bacterium]